MNTVLRLDQVGFERDRRSLLTDVTFCLESDATLAVLGPSGGGKTTLLRLIMGLERPSAGSIDVAGRCVSDSRQILLPPEQRGIAMVFQDLGLWPHMTVEGHLQFALASQGGTRQERSARIRRMLAAVGLMTHAQRRPGTLSGGERQRVAIARALIVEPRIVLLDEPLANLDVALKQQLIELFRQLLHERPVTAIYVTHDPYEAIQITDRYAVLEGGRIVQSGLFSERHLPAATEFSDALLNYVADGPQRRHQAINKDGERTGKART